MNINELELVSALSARMREALADGERLERLVAPPVDARKWNVAHQRGGQSEPQRVPAVNL